ncbi:hypothetical protein Tco_0191859 [Tanacetum coccineum]
MAVIEDCWFQAMQDEIHEFDRLEVWELVPRPIYVMVIALKWIYKVKWKIEWLNSTSWKRIINLQIFSPKPYQENGLNFFFHA